MRRKTAAKRVLNDGDGDGESPEESGARENHVVRQDPWKRRTVRGQDEDENSSCNEDYIKYKTRVFEVDEPITDHVRDDLTLEVLASLQSRSKAELVAMVLSMRREMDSIREQIRCLTACGKLAQTLEELMEKRDALANDIPMLSPSFPKQLGKLGFPAQIALPTARKTQSAHQRESEELTQRNGLLFQQKIITADLLEQCNTGTTAQKLTNDLLRSLYDRDCLASHSVSGTVHSKRAMPKPALPAHEIHAVLRTVQRFFPGKTDQEIKCYIRQKLQNEAKRIRKRPHPGGDPHVGAPDEVGKGPEAFVFE